MAIGFLVCAAWYYTILAGFYVLYCPVMYLMFIKHKFYRNVVDVLFSLWELYPVALFQWCCNTELHHYGDHVNPDETTIIVMNHRTRVDWNYVWIALYHATQRRTIFLDCTCKEKNNQIKSELRREVLDVVTGGKSKIKFVLKDEIKAIPGIGWIMQLNYFLYLKRNWQEDEVNITQFIDYYKRLRYHQRVVLFPEGTDLSEDNKRRSEKFALSRHLPNFEFVLHPRTTGWAVLCSRLRHSRLASVYDVTVAYDVPAQTEMDLLHGKIPKHVHFHIKRINHVRVECCQECWQHFSVKSLCRFFGKKMHQPSCHQCSICELSFKYDIEDLPYEEEELRTWLQDRWKEKNTSLESFHKGGSFIDFSSNSAPQRREPRSLLIAKLAFVFWTIIDFLFIYWLYYSVLFKFWVIYHTLLYIFVTKYFGGFHNIQYKILEKTNII